MMADFNKDGIALGLLYGTFDGHWSMSFYTTEKGRNLGLASLRRLVPNRPVYKFSLNLKELHSKAQLIPSIPDEKQQPDDQTIYFKRSKLA